MPRLLFLIALCLPLVVGAQSQWSWRDAQGRVQFSDRPPPQGTPEKDILSRPGASKRAPVQVIPFGQAASAPAAAAAPAAKASTPQERVAANDKARQAAEKEAQQKAQERREAQARAENCQRARMQLAGLESGARVSTLNERGERVFMEDAQRNQEIARMREVVAADCR